MSTINDVTRTFLYTVRPVLNVISRVGSGLPRYSTESESTTSHRGPPKSCGLALS